MIQTNHVRIIKTLAPNKPLPRTLLADIPPATDAPCYANLFLNWPMSLVNFWQKSFFWHTTGFYLGPPAFLDPWHEQPFDPGWILFSSFIPFLRSPNEIGLGMTSLSTLPSIYQHVIRAWRPKHVVQKRRINYQIDGLGVLSRKRLRKMNKEGKTAQTKDINCYKN